MNVHGNLVMLSAAVFIFAIAGHALEVPEKHELGPNDFKLRGDYRRYDLEDRIISLGGDLYDREYDLALTPVKSNYDFTIVSGVVEDCSSSEVVGTISKAGLFQGRVACGNETILIENSDNSRVYFKLDLSNEITGLCSNDGQAVDHARPVPFLRPVDREKRAPITVASSESTCRILAIADHTFSHAYSDSLDAIASALNYFVLEADNIYRKTDFNGISGYRLQIGGMMIFTNTLDDEYPFKHLLEREDSTSYLAALRDWSRRTGTSNQYCLVVSFTARDFLNVLGQAYNDQLCGDSNAVVVSMHLGGRTRPRYLVALTTAHEVAHSFGSHGHDDTGHPAPDPACAPGGRLGNFLMFSVSTDGTRRNNARFSPCSVAMMSDTLAREDTRRCLSWFEESICGNRVVEEGEDCDCGWGDQCGDKCCLTSVQGSSESGGGGCVLNPVTDALCSPSRDECCDAKTCDAFPPGKPCGSDDQCAEGRVCDGFNYSCPEPVIKSNGSLCANGTQTCFNGQCLGSVCLSVGEDYHSCACQGLEDSLCVVCCSKGGGACTAIHEIGSSAFSAMQYVAPGSLCSDSSGYCNEYHKCIRYQQEGAILQLAKFVLSQDDLMEFLLQYWWAPVAVILVYALIMSLIACNFALYSPHPHPELRPNHWYHNPTQPFFKKWQTVAT